MINAGKCNSKVRLGGHSLSCSDRWSNWVCCRTRPLFGREQLIRFGSDVMANLFWFTSQKTMRSFWTLSCGFRVVFCDITQFPDDRRRFREKRVFSLFLYRFKDVWRLVLTDIEINYKLVLLEVLTGNKSLNLMSANVRLADWLARFFYYIIRLLFLCPSICSWLSHSLVLL